MNAAVSITKCPPKSMMNLHHELGKSEINGHKVRFCQHVNGACFWLSVDDDLYLVETEELMNAVLNAVMPTYDDSRDSKPDAPKGNRRTVPSRPKRSA